MSTQNSYWIEMDQAIFGKYYILQELRKAEKYHQVLKMFMAFTSSSSIAAWTIWKDLSQLWGAIIALSQVLNAVEKYLPWQKRVSSLTSMYHEYQTLIITLEENWFKVSNGSLTEEEILKLRLKFQQKRSNIEKKCLKETLKKDKKFVDEATKEKDAYLKNHYF